MITILVDYIVPILLIVAMICAVYRWNKINNDMIE